MEIAIGADHAGYDVKQQTKLYLEKLGHVVLDMGTNSEDSVDYPEFGHKVGNAVASGRVRYGIVVCGSGIGISIAANKVSGVRAAVCTSIEQAQMCRSHNDANVLAIGARLTSTDDIRAIIDRFFATPFLGGKHERRVAQLERIGAIE
jgi:ribose 5-phosphate isomerase B